MKKLTLLSALLVGASGFLFKFPTYITPSPITGNTEWVHRQKLILPLFENVCDPSTNPTVIRLSEEFTTETTSSNFINAAAYENFKNLLSGKGLLPKGEIFSEYNKDHLDELQVISELLLSARDFSTFLKTAAWIRQNINCGLYVNAIYTSIINRRDTEKLSVPAPYELLPNYFITKDGIITGSSLLAGATSKFENVKEDGNSYVVNSNYTADINEDDESRLAYFHEDVGLNAYYFLKRLEKKWFIKPNNTESNHGEYLYLFMKQLSARYDLERYTNNFEAVQEINWDSMSELNYDSMLIYSNGNRFSKTKFANLANSEEISFLKNIESSIGNVVNNLVQKGYNKNYILNNIMDILVMGDNSYEWMSHSLLKKFNDLDGSPSVLGHYLTSVRDPTFWKINKKIVNLVDNCLKMLPSYSRNELYFPGLEIVSVDVKKIATSFEDFEFDATDALKPEDSQNSFQIKFLQSRLNHKAFNFKVNITSLVSQKGLMKIYLGPKILPGELVFHKNKFVLLDSCEINLKKGSNMITRSSEELSSLSHDFLSLKSLYKNVEDAELGLGDLPKENVKDSMGYPSRLVLPKGTEDGVPMKIFIFIAPFTKTAVGDLGIATTDFNYAVLSPNYPFDLDIEDTTLFDLPNTIVKEVLITHKDASSSGKYNGSTNKWDSDNAFDYSSKKGAYNKQSYSVERPYYENNGNLLENKPEYLKEQTTTSKEFTQEILDDVSTTETYKEKNTNNKKSDSEENMKQQKKFLNLTQSKPSKRKPTVYDYIVHNLYDYDDDDDEHDSNQPKVYE